jgi:hypothetical protein
MEETKGDTMDGLSTTVKPMSSLVSLDFEIKALELYGHVEDVSTHYRDLLRDGPAEERAWVAGMQASHGEIASIELAAMKRSRDFMLILADEMARKRGQRIYRRAFVSWRVHVFRYIFLREQILHNYLVHTFMARRFYAWRLVARRNPALALCIRQCWRRRRKYRFLWWKHAARWRALWLRLTLRSLRVMKSNVALMKTVRRRWQAVGRHKREDWAARKMQKAQRWHAPRLRHWAAKRIKMWMLNRFGLGILKQRRKEELRRANYERETSDILVRRALENLDGLLNDEGNVILSQYLRSVNGVAKQIETALPGTALSTAKLFPAPKDAPEMAKLWTARAKAMAVLRMRCTAEVVRLARRRFRQSSPSLYECRRCAATFLLRVEKLRHLMADCPLIKVDDIEEDDDSDDDDEDDGDGEEHDGEEHVGGARGRVGQSQDDDDDEAERGDVLRELRGRKQKNTKGNSSVGKKKTRSSAEDKWRRRQKAKAKGFIVSEDNADELERDYICWKLAAPIVEAALQPLAAYLTKQAPHPGGAAYVLRKQQSAR